VPAKIKIRKAVKEKSSPKNKANKKIPGELSNKAVVYLEWQKVS